MTDNDFSLLHNFEPRRDSYGFALRPQYAQSYRQYASIYKEEEAERADKWRGFLDQVVKSSQPCSSQNEDKEISKAEGSEIKEETNSRRVSEGNDLSVRKSCEGTDVEEEAGADRVSEGSDLSSRKSAEVAEIKEETSPGKLREGDNSSVRKSAEGSEIKEETRAERIGEDNDSSVRKFCEGTEVEEEAGADRASEGNDSSGRISVEGAEIKEETSPGKLREGGNSSVRKPSEGSEIKEETSAERVNEGNDLSVRKSCEGTEVEGSGADRISEGNDLSGRKSAEGAEIKEETCPEKLREGDNSSTRKPAEGSEVKEETSAEKVSEGNDSSIRKPFSHDSTTTSSSEKEVHYPEERKARKVQTWGEIRPSLTAIEKLMSNRVKKAKKINGELTNGIYDHLPSIEKSEPLEGVSESPLKVLESLVQGGVPKDLRGEVWQAFLGVKTRRVERYYEDLVAQESNSSESMELDVSPGSFRQWRKQIEKDIPRTFPGHPALDENGRNSLRRLLLAYARHNPSVGYCQAMNFFAGLLLLLMPEENAFWALVGIIDDYFEGYFTEEMVESQVDQLVFEQLMRERFPKLVNHLDYLGVQVAWISGPWFLSIFVNMIPWESVLRVWDVLLFEGNRVMLFRTALALMELYGPALVTTKDAGDAITLLQSLAGSTFDSSQLIFTACVSFLAVTETRLQELREKHRSSVLVVVDERSKMGRVWKDSKGLASKLYSFKHSRGSLVEESKTSEGDDMVTDADKMRLESHSSNLDELLNSLNADSEVDSLPDLQEQVDWLKVELCRILEEKRSAILRAEELETALMEMVTEDNRRELSARVEQLEQEVAELQQALADKKLQEAAMLEVLMRVELEQKVTEDARRRAEQDLAAQKYVVHLLQEKYDKAMASINEMEKRAVMAESMLEATLQYESGQSKALSSPRPDRTQSPTVEIPPPKVRLLNFGLSWRDRIKGKTTNGAECSESQSNNHGRGDPATPSRESNN